MTDEENDIEAEAETWRRWDANGRKTNCLGLVAATCLLLVAAFALPVWMVLV